MTTTTKKDEIMESIKQLNVMDLVDLVNDLEKEFGVSAAPLPAVILAPPPSKDETAQAVEDESFNLWLVSSGEKRVGVIKVVRLVIPKLGLMEAKNLVEEAPVMVLTGVTKEEAEAAGSKLEEAGATVSIEPA